MVQVLTCYKYTEGWEEEDSLNRGQNDQISISNEGVLKRKKANLYQQEGTQFLHSQSQSTRHGSCRAQMSKKSLCHSWNLPSPP